MKQPDPQELCLALLQADSETEVVKLLEKAGYWRDAAVWRDYGDQPGNAAIIHNQSSNPVAAIAEKVTNAFDAVLFNQALTKKVPLQGAQAPQNVAQAVQHLILGSPIDLELREIQDLPEYVRGDWRNRISIIATGAKTSPSISIVDEGEGQTPSRMPTTLLSLLKDNKAKVPFAHGKFNMGGSGALPFCSPTHNLQLIVTRRNPNLIPQTANADDYCWGVTIVRKEPPRPGERSSVYRYLAPVGGNENPENGTVLSFSADSLKLAPAQGQPYQNPISHGTLVKMYEYQMPVKWDITQHDALLGRLESLLPEPALPLHIYECRDYAKKGNMELRGATRRMLDNSETWLEPGFPVKVPLTVHGERFNVSIYVAQEGAHRNRLPTGILYTINGQTHDQHDSRFFVRDNIRLGYLQKSLLLVVDCSQISLSGVEALFHSSRDRMRESTLARDLIDALAKTITDNDVLKKLNAERRNHVLKEESENDQKSLAQAVQDVLTSIPDLALWLQPGQRLSNPLAPENPVVPPSFSGKYLPTFFDPKVGRGRGFGIERAVRPDARIKWTFNTDAENEYFTRPKDTGKMEILIAGGNDLVAVEDVIGPVLKDGECYISFEIPDNLRHHSALEVLFSVTDSQRKEPFQHIAKLTVQDGEPSKPGPRNPPKEKKNRLDIPSPIEVSKSGWDSHIPPFNGTTALRIVQKPDEKGYDFYVNTDNTYLLHYIERTKADPSRAKAYFGTAQVLIGLSLINSKNHENFGLAASEVLNARQQNNNVSLEDRIEQITSDISSILMPLLHTISIRHAEDTLAPQDPFRRAPAQPVLRAVT